jgi:hypothetical protein
MTALMTEMLNGLGRVAWGLFRRDLRDGRPRDTKSSPDAIRWNFARVDLPAQPLARTVDDLAGLINRETVLVELRRVVSGIASALD